MTAPARRHHHRWTTRGLWVRPRAWCWWSCWPAPRPWPARRWARPPSAPPAAPRRRRPASGWSSTTGSSCTDTTPPATTDQCVTLGSGTGLALLTAAGHTYRLNGSGLLCSIDGYPSSGCGDDRQRQVPLLELLAGWLELDLLLGRAGGPHRGQDGDVEGWHFVEGARQPGRPAAGLAPRPARARRPPRPRRRRPRPSIRPSPTRGCPGWGPGRGRRRRQPPGVPTSPRRSRPAPAGCRSGVEPGSTGDTIRREGLTAAESLHQPGRRLSTPPAPTDDGSSDEPASGDSARRRIVVQHKGVPVLMAGGGVVIVALGVAAALRFRVRPDA